MNPTLVLASLVGFGVTTALMLGAGRISHRRVRGLLQNVGGGVGFVSLVLMYNGFDPVISPWEQIWQPPVDDPTSLGTEIESLDFDGGLVIVHVSPERSKMIQDDCTSGDAIYRPLHLSLIDYVEGAGEAGVISSQSWDRVRLEIRAAEGRCLLFFPALQDNAADVNPCAC